MAANLISASAQVDRTTEPRALFVPVDASAASRNAVETAIQLAQLRPARIVLMGQVASLSAAAGMDPDEARALLMAGELGHGVSLAPPVLDEEERTVQRLRCVLLPLQQKVRAAGVPTALRLLRGDAQAEQLREILSSAPPSSVLVLSEPSQLYGSLHDITTDLLADPPCSVYCCGIQGRDRPLGLLLLHQMAKSLWRLLGR